MAKKTLLNEAQVRRFMGLAGMQSNLVSNYLKEGGYHMSEEDPDAADLEAPPADDDMAGDDMAMDAEPMEPMADEPADMDMPAGDDDPGEVTVSAEDVEAAQEQAQGLVDFISQLAGGAPMGDEPADMDMPAGDEELPADDMAAGDEELPADDMAADEEEKEGDVLEGVDLQLSEEEVVTEVARRVAKRIMEAKRSQVKMNKALGRRKNTSRRRK